MGDRIGSERKEDWPESFKWIARHSQVIIFLTIVLSVIFLLVF